MGLKKKQEEDYAKILFTQHNLTRKEVSERVGVSEKTVGRWADKGNWDALKRSLLTTKKQQITQLYEQLEWINSHISTRDVVYDIPASLLKPSILKNEDGEKEYVYPKYNETDYPIRFGNVATSKEADVIAKLTASINKLENETSIGHIVEVAQDFIAFSKGVDFSLAKEITSLFDMFINHKMSANG